MDTSHSYEEMGHFLGKSDSPSLGFTVLPGLGLNYFGQGENSNLNIPADQVFEIGKRVEMNDVI